jgi:peptidoglycan/LPS O-acetylase OafA/YrhL
MRQMSHRSVSGHMPQLDGIRAVAVLFVIAQHFLPAATRVIPLGVVGVYTFFVLSGFLITGILLKGRDQAESLRAGRLGVLRQFYARRFLRIFPLYYAALFLLAAANIGEARHGLAWYALYLANFHVVAVGDWAVPVSHFWTLAVEEQFYVVWPWVIMFVPRRMLAPSILLSIAVGIAWKAFLHHHFYLAVVGTPGALDSLGAGALLAYIHRTRPELIRRLAGGLFLMGLPLLAAMAVTRAVHPSSVAVYIAAGLAAATAGVAVVHFAAEDRAGHWLSSRPLTYIGRISYGIYVWHYPVGYEIQRHIARLFPTSLAAEATFLLTCMVTLVVATISWQVYECPLNELKRYFPYVRRPYASVTVWDAPVPVVVKVSTPCASAGAEL